MASSQALHPHAVAYTVGSEALYDTAFISSLHILFLFAFHSSPTSVCEGQMKAEVNGSKEE